MGIISYLFSKYPAPICFVTGRMGYGKTDFSLLIAETLLKNNIVKMVGTNIKTEDSRIDYLTNVYQLKKWMQKKGSKLFILDEAGVHIDSRSALSKMNREIRKIAFLLRKFDGKLLLVSQRSEDLDSTFRDSDIWLATFYKQELKRCIVYANPLPEPIILTDIPKTSIPYDTKDIALFGFEFNPEDAETFEDKLLTEWLETGSFNKVAQKHGLYAMQVKRLILDKVKQLKSMSLSV